jgi:hypothetical protein
MTVASCIQWVPVNDRICQQTGHLGLKAAVSAGNCEILFIVQATRRAIHRGHAVNTSL